MKVRGLSSASGMILKKYFQNFLNKKSRMHLHPAFGVIPLGFEPRTHTLKVYCSTS
jgi:hypothetical protein